VEDKTRGPAWWREISVGYLAHLARKGRRPNTMRAYGAELLAFGRWLDRQGIPDVSQLTGGHLERFQDERAGAVKPKTQQVSASALRGLLRWAATQEPPLSAAALWLRVTMPRTRQMMPRPIPRADLDRLLAELAPCPVRGGTATIPGPAGPELEHLLRLRTRALFFVIFSSGARISEALQLNRDQLRDRTATIIQKGGGEKLLVVNAAAEIAVADYLAARRDSCSAMFVEHGPQQRTARRLARSSEQLRWDLLCRQLGIQRFTTHQIRHTCATELLRQHVDSIVIAKHLGHRGLTTIQNYAEVGLDTRHEMLEVMDGRIRGAASAPAAHTDETADEVMTVSDVWLQVRVNFDLGNVTRGEMENFARLTCRPDLIEESALTVREFAELVVSEGGEYPLPAGPHLSVLPDPGP
jgi:integrase/recombinase XerD